MAGRMELEHAGRHITLVRESVGRVPMGRFSAYDTDTGQPIDALSAETCGQTLLGVPRSVFERSAFVRQLGLGVTQDDALEARLSALVTSGEETVSYPETERRLHVQINACRHNRTGKLPEAERALDAVRAALDQIHSAHRKDLALHERMQQLTAQHAELEAAQEALSVIEENRRAEQKAAAKRAMEQAEQALRTAEKRTEKLPPEQTLRQLAQDAQTLLSRKPAQIRPLSKKEPVCPDALSGVPDAEILARAQKDRTEYARLTAGRQRPFALFLALAFAMLAGAASLALLNQVLFAACAAAAGVLFLGLAVWASVSNRARRARQEQAQALLARYGAKTPDGILACAAAYREQQLAWQQAVSRWREERAAAEREARQDAQNAARILGSARMFARDTKTLSDAETAAHEALAAYDALRASQRACEAAREHYAAVCAAIGDAQTRPVPAGDFSGLTPEIVSRAIARNAREQADVSSELDLARGRVQALGDEAALHAREELLLARISEIEERRAALELASDALRAANDELAARFSPELMRRAGDILSRLTAGRYDRVLLDRQMNLQAGSSMTPAMRQLPALSCGTADQMYLSLRLAICALLLPEDAPIVLDDALVMFDDARMRLALRVLRQQAETRQILLFTCHAREAEALAQA